MPTASTVPSIRGACTIQSKHSPHKFLKLEQAVLQGSLFPCAAIFSTCYHMAGRPFIAVSTAASSFSLRVLCIMSWCFVLRFFVQLLCDLGWSTCPYCLHLRLLPFCYYWRAAPHLCSHHTFCFLLISYSFSLAGFLWKGLLNVTFLYFCRKFINPLETKTILASLVFITFSPSPYKSRDFFLFFS